MCPSLYLVMEREEERLEVTDVAGAASQYLLCVQFEQMGGWWTVYGYGQANVRAVLGLEKKW